MSTKEEHAKSLLLERLIMAALRYHEETLPGLLSSLNYHDMGFINYWGREFSEAEIQQSLEEMITRNLVIRGLARDIVPGRKDHVHDDELCYTLSEFGDGEISRLDLPDDVDPAILNARRNKEDEFPERARSAKLEAALPDFLLYLMGRNLFMYLEEIPESLNFVYSCWREAGGYTLTQHDIESALQPLLRECLVRWSTDVELKTRTEDGPTVPILFVTEKGRVSAYPPSIFLG